MCCRLRLDNRELQKRGGGLFGANPLTGSIGVVTINLPRIGYLSKNKTEFLDRVKAQVLIAKERLAIKRKVLEKFTDNDYEIVPESTDLIRAPWNYLLYILAFMSLFQIIEKLWNYFNSFGT